jgi:peptidoglycan/xylan/chitin deacetylase (PgdA/CDA1 family)
MTINRRTFLAGASGVAATSTDQSATTAPVVGAPTAPAPPTTTGKAAFVSTGPRASRGVALTFHGQGPLALARAILSKAAVLKAPISVFAVGTWLADNPGIAKEILAGGHELANHTWSHGNIIQMGAADVAAEITRCRDTIAEQTGVTADYFRPSQTDVPNDLILQQAGAAGYATVVGFDVDPSDYKDPGSTAVVTRTRAALHPGAIVSLHLGHQGTVTAFDSLVADIRARGLQPMLVRDLLAS